MKGLISIFALPQEIDSLYTTLYNLRRNAVHLDEKNIFGFDITLCLSDELTNWSTSAIPREYFEDRFYDMTTKLCDWATPQSIRIEYSNDVLGCVSQRRHSLKYLNDYDYTMWLDTDLFFSDYYLSYVHLAAKSVQHTSGYIITPQITRQWDASWDILVNDNLRDVPLNNNLTADVFSLSLQSSEEVSVIPIDSFKFAGGWGTVISNKLLDAIGIPNSLGHYGMEDTYVMNCASILRKKYPSHGIQQYVLNNVLVCENHKYRMRDYMRSVISPIDKKEQFRKVATENFSGEIQRFITRTLS